MCIQATSTLYKTWIGQTQRTAVRHTALEVEAAAVTADLPNNVMTSRNADVS
jgi:hypothetical protein